MAIGVAAGGAGVGRAEARAVQAELLGDLPGGLIGDQARDKIGPDGQRLPRRGLPALGVVEVHARQPRADDHGDAVARQVVRRRSRPASAQACRAASRPRWMNRDPEPGDRRVLPVESRARPPRPGRRCLAGTPPGRAAPGACDRPDLPATSPSQVRSMSGPRQVTAAWPTTTIRSVIRALPVPIRRRSVRPRADRSRNSRRGRTILEWRADRASAPISATPIRVRPGLVGCGSTGRGGRTRPIDRTRLLTRRRISAMQIVEIPRRPRRAPLARPDRRRSRPPPARLPSALSTLLHATDPAAEVRRRLTADRPPLPLALGPPAAPRRRPASLGRRRHLHPQQGRPPGGIRAGRLLLRPRLHRRPPRAVLQGHRRPRRRPRRPDPRPLRHGLERPRARAGPGPRRHPPPGRPDHRQRRQRPRHRGAQSPLSAPGQGLRRLLRPRSRPSPCSRRVPDPAELAITLEITPRRLRPPSTARPPPPGWPARFDDLIAWLGRDHSFPDGVVLLTGTGIVPPDEFTLQPGDVVRIDDRGAWGAGESGGRSLSVEEGRGGGRRPRHPRGKRIRD